MVEPKVTERELLSSQCATAPSLEELGPAAMLQGQEGLQPHPSKPALLQTGRNTRFLFCSLGKEICALQSWACWKREGFSPSGTQELNHLLVLGGGEVTQKGLNLYSNILSEHKLNKRPIQQKVKDKRVKADPLFTSSRCALRAGSFQCHLCRQQLCVSSQLPCKKPLSSLHSGVWQHLCFCLSLCVLPCPSLMVCAEWICPPRAVLKHFLCGMHGWGIDHLGDRAWAVLASPGGAHEPQILLPSAP